MRRWLAILAWLGLLLAPGWAEGGNEVHYFLGTFVTNNAEHDEAVKSAPAPGQIVYLHVAAKEGSKLSVITAAYEGSKQVMPPQLQDLTPREDEMTVMIEWPSIQRKGILFVMFVDGDSPDLPKLRKLVDNATTKPAVAGPELYRQMSEVYNTGLSRGGAKPEILGGIIPSAATRARAVAFLPKWDWKPLGKRLTLPPRERRAAAYRVEPSK